MALLLGACDVPFDMLDAQGKCERVQRDDIAYVGHWKVECQEGALANPNWMAVCYCNGDPSTFVIKVRTDNLNPADPQHDLAHRLAHEYGHAWYSEYGTVEQGHDEHLAEEWAAQNLRS